MLGSGRSVALRRAAGRVAGVAWRAAREYSRDRCPQMAAAISYHVLFSIFPLTILLVSVLGLVLRDEERRQRVVEWVLDAFPLSEAAAVDVERAVEGLATPLSAVGLVSLLALLWSASGMMAAIQAALASVWKAERRPVLRAKVVDLLLVLAAGLLVLVSFGLTILARVVRRSSEEDAEALGAFGAVVSAAGELTAIVVPLVISFVTFTLAYRYVPRARPGYREALLGAVVATAGFELAKTGFAFYLAGFARYNLIYGSLGAVVAFLFFVYVAASVFLYGAEVAAAWPRKGRRPGGR